MKYLLVFLLVISFSLLAHGRQSDQTLYKCDFLVSQELSEKLLLSETQAIRALGDDRYDLSEAFALKGMTFMPGMGTSVILDKKNKTLEVVAIQDEIDLFEELVENYWKIKIVPIKKPQPFIKKP